MKSLHEIITNIQKDISKQIIDINYGGCGWFSFYMNRELSKLGINSEIVILDGDDIYDKKLILNDIMNNNNTTHYNRHAVSFNHCCIRIGNLNFDGVKMNAIESWEAIGRKERGLYSIEEMETALKYGCWCSCYDTNQNSKLELIIISNLNN